MSRRPAASVSTSGLQDRECQLQCAEKSSELRPPTERRPFFSLPGRSNGVTGVTLAASGLAGGPFSAHRSSDAGDASGFPAVTSVKLGLVSTSAERMRRLRARQAEGLEPAGGRGLRDAAELLSPAVEETLAALKLTERDAAAAQLALGYARTIDEAQDPAYAMRHLGPLLLKALEALRATPAARGAVKPERGRPSKVTQLRAAHVASKAQQRRG